MAHLPSGNFIRTSAKTRSWEAAEKKARTLEANEAIPSAAVVSNSISAPVAASDPDPSLLSQFASDLRFQWS